MSATSVCLFADDLRLWKRDDRPHAKFRERAAPMSPAPPPNFSVELIDDVLVVTAVCHQIVAENRDERYAVAGRLAAASGPKRWF